MGMLTLNFLAGVQLFIVLSLYEHLVGQAGSFILALCILVSLLCRFFYWEAVWNKILTLENVQKRRIPIVNSCFLGIECEESINLLLDRPKFC